MRILKIYCLLNLMNIYKYVYIQYIQFFNLIIITSVGQFRICSFKKDFIF